MSMFYVAYVSPIPVNHLSAYNRNFLQLKVIVLFMDTFLNTIYNYNKETIASTHLRAQLCIEAFVYNL